MSKNSDLMQENVCGFKIGSSATLTHHITMDDVKLFAEITGDDNPVHLDREFAERTKFKGTIAHGMLGSSFLSTLIGKHLPGEGAVWLSQSINYIRPVRIGDTLTIRAEVIGLVVAENILHLKTEIHNQHGQVVTSGEAKVRALETDRKTSHVDLNDQGPERQVVLITGASRGIGAATAQLLAKKGYSVVLNYHNDEEGARRVATQIELSGGCAMGVRADITKPEDVSAMIKSIIARFGGLSAVVNNACAPITAKSFEETSTADLQWHIEVNYYGAYQVIQQSLPYLEKAQNASVVNVGTIYTDNVPPPKLFPYHASKAALVSLTRALAVEYGPKKIRFNVVSPGMTNTALIADTPESVQTLTKTQTPLKSLASPKDIADAISFLLSPEADYITGETLRVCGGVVMV